jgi:hypothetical protein
MEAITREEKIMSGENLTPITRKEMFLAKAAGQDVKTPQPITREEMFLSKISSGGGSVEGTAIPVGVRVEKIYFNMGLSTEEMKAYLSQLTYVDIGLGYPVNVVFASDRNFLLVMQVVGGYHIAHNTVPYFDGNEIILYEMGGREWYSISRYKGYDDGMGGEEDEVVSRCGIGALFLENTSLADFNGFPIGAENEKIKNVLSITPFE